MESLEEDLQAQLEPPRDVALAAGMPKVLVSIIRLPERVYRAEESTVEDVSSIGLEPHVPALTEVGVLIDREVFVEVLKPADIFIISRSITKGERAGVRPSRLIEITVRRGILERSRQPTPHFIGELIVVEEEPPKNAVVGGDGERPPGLVRLSCRDLPIADDLVDKSRGVSSHPLALSERQLVHPAERKNVGHVVGA